MFFARMGHIAVPDEMCKIKIHVSEAVGAFIHDERNLRILR